MAQHSLYTRWVLSGTSEKQENRSYSGKYRKRQTKVRLSVPDQGQNCQTITFQTESTDDSFAVCSHVRMLSEGFAGMDIGDMDFVHRSLDGSYRIGNGQ